MKKGAPALTVSRFQPLAALATSKVNDLIGAGATLGLVGRTKVQRQHIESLATIIDGGRVIWGPHLGRG